MGRENDGYANCAGQRTLLAFSHIAKTFPVKGGALRALDDVSLSLRAGECVAVVGESGCGKSTLARIAAHMEAPDSGQVRFEGTDISGLRGEALRQYRRNVQMIFQDSSAAISPRMKVGAFLMEPWRQYARKTRAEARALAAYGLTRVGLPETYLDKYPHQLSGGELQRVCAARAIALHPKLLLCDEITSALDVSVQSQIMALLKEHRTESGCAFLFISHDMALAEDFGDRVAVMYRGRIVEVLPGGHLRRDAGHPYTRALLDAVISVHDTGAVLRGSLPEEALHPPALAAGCAFYPRCAFADERCRREAPPLCEIAPGHSVACWRCVREIRSGDTFISVS